jgi:hypothetical protein
VHVERVDRRNAELQLRRPGLLEGQFRLDNRHLGRCVRVARQNRGRSVVEAIVSVGRRVIERQSGDIRRRIVDTYRDIEHDLLAYANVDAVGHVFDNEVRCVSGVYRR